MISHGNLTDVLNQIPQLMNLVLAHRERIITNTILIGQIPPISINAKDDEVENVNTNLRAKMLLERMAELGVDECTTDQAGNPIGVIKGTGESDQSIVIAAHMDTVYHFDQEIHLAIGVNTITGPGIIDNSISLGVLLSIPEILKDLGIKLSCDLVLLGLNESLGDYNLRGIREFLAHWRRPIQAGIILEGAELGRLNYFSRSMTRMEITCSIPMKTGWENKYGNNAILILNEVINSILEIHLPQRPSTQIILGKIRGGIKHGDRALSGVLGLEIESGDDAMVRKISNSIESIVDSLAHEYLADLTIRQLSSVQAAKLEYTHPLVKAAVTILEAMDVKPRVESSESELGIFLSHGIPAVTLGLTHGENYHTLEATVEIEPLSKGIAQIISLIQAVDKGILVQGRDNG